MKTSTLRAQPGYEQPLQRLRRHPVRAIRYLLRWTEFCLRPSETEEKLSEDAQSFWRGPDSALLNQYSHWRGAGPFADDERWLALGKKNLELFKQFSCMTSMARPARRIVEWGCGGGANAVHFAPLADVYIGIDISEPSLHECARQIEAAGLHNFEPVLIDIDSPEAALTKIKQKCDLFLSTYVFELLPSPEYGLKVLKIARELLNDGGMAIIQIRFIRDSWRSQPKRFAYRRNISSNTAYRIETFWDESERCGFLPRAVRLQSQEVLNDNTDYAYFLLAT